MKKPRYSGIFRRLFAFAIDSALLICIYAVLGLILGIGVFTYTLAAIPMIGFWFYGGLFFLSWFYFAGMESSTHQATIGKKVLGLKVADLKGKRIGFGRASARYFGRILSRALLFIGFITILFTKKKQAIHDMITSTVILHTK